MIFRDCMSSWQACSGKTFVVRGLYAYHLQENVLVPFFNRLSWRSFIVKDLVSPVAVMGAI